jgi:hypothetical protein
MCSPGAVIIAASGAGPQCGRAQGFFEDLAPKGARER